MRLKKSVLSLGLIFASFCASLAFAAPCESERLTAPVRSMMYVLISGLNERMTGVDDLKRLAAGDWKNPFASSESAARGPMFMRAFAQLATELTAPLRAELQRELAAELTKHGTGLETASRAHVATEKIFNVSQVAKLDDVRRNIGDARIFERASLDGRPVFVELLIADGEHDLAAIYDPLNSERALQVRTVPVKRLDNWHSTDGRYLKRDGRELMIYPHDRVAIDLKGGKNVSQEFSAAEFGAIAESTASSRPITWRTANTRITFYENGKKLKTVMIPRDGSFNSDDKHNIKIVSAGDSLLALIPCSLDSEKKLLVSDLRGHMRTKNFSIDGGDLNFAPFGLTLHKAHWVIYWVSSHENKMTLHILDTGDGQERTTPIYDDEAPSIAEFSWNGGRNLIFTDKRGLVIYDVDAHSPIVTRRDDIWAVEGSFIFEHDGDIYYFLVDRLVGEDRVFKLTSGTEPGK